MDLSKLSNEELLALKARKQTYAEPTLLDKAAQSATRLGKSAIEALPFGGALLGGTLGTVGGPVGTVAGAGLGAAGGKSLQNLIEKYLMDQEKTRSDIYLGPLKEGLAGAAGEGAGQLLSKGISTGLQKGGEAFYKRAFLPIDLYAKKEGKKIIPSKVFWEEGLTPAASEAQEAAKNIIERELGKVTETMTQADEAAIQQGIFSDPQRVYAPILESKKELEKLSKFHELPESIAKNIEEYTSEQIARQTPRRTYSPETGATVLKNMEDYSKAMKEYESNMAARSLAEKWGIQAPEAIAKPVMPEQLPPDINIPGLLPSELASLKAKLYREIPSGKWGEFAQSTAGQEMLKREALGMKQETERLADLLVPQLAGQVKKSNELAGTMLTVEKALASEAAKQAKMPAVTQVTGSLAGGAISNPSVLPFLIGKDVVRTAQFMGPRTKMGMGAYKAGKAVEEGVLDPVLKAILIKQMQGE